MKSCVGLAAGCLLALGAAGAATQTTEGADTARVAMVNGEPILAEEVARQLGGMHAAVAEGERPTFDLDALMFKLVNDALLAQEARAMEMDLEPKIREKVEAYRVRLARAHLERLEVADRSRATPEETRRLLEDQYQRATFRIITSYEQAGAEQLLAELRSGADVEELAREKSVDPYRLRGGLVNDVARIDLQRGVAELVFSLEPGEIGGPVRTNLGWSVVRLEKLSPADPDRFPELERSLAALVRQQKAAARRQELAAELEAKYPVAIDREALAAIEPKRLPDARLIPEIPDPEQVIVRIGEGTTISAAEYGQELLGRWKGVRNEEAARAAEPLILRKLIEERLLETEASARGYGVLPEISRAVRAYETSLLVPRFLEEVVAADITVSEEEKEAYYEEHRNEFHRPPRVRLGQITVASREEADRIVELLEGGSDLAWLVEQHSLDAFEAKGGDRGWMTPQPGVEGIQQELFDAKVGHVLEPFETLEGFVVWKVTGREEQGVYALEEISGNIREAVFAAKFREELDGFVTTLRERSEIEIDQKALAALDISATKADGKNDEGTGSGHYE